MSDPIEPVEPVVAAVAAVAVVPVVPVAPLRIGLVAEGTTEWEVIDAALKAIFTTRPYVLTRLQPDATQPKLGQGWGGVLKWCQQVAQRTPAGGRTIESDPTLSLFDAVVLQLDADVATFKYDQLGAQFDAAEVARQGWHTLPCPTACPPAAVSADPLRAVLLSWLHPATQGPRTVVCLPAMNTGAWQAAAMLPAAHALLPALECRADIETRLAQLPVTLRVDKGKRTSRLRAAAEVTKRWADVTARCTRAAEFDRDIRTALP